MGKLLELFKEVDVVNGIALDILFETLPEATKRAVKSKRVRDVAKSVLFKSTGCGANGPGGGGFQPGNTCGSLKNASVGVAEAMEGWDDDDMQDGFVRLIGTFGDRDREQYMEYLESEYPGLSQQIADELNARRVKETTRIKQQMSSQIREARELIADPSKLTVTIPKKLESQTFTDPYDVDEAVEQFFDSATTSPLNYVKEAKPLNASVKELINDHNVIAKPVMQIERESIDDYLNDGERNGVVQAIANRLKKKNGLEVSKSYRNSKPFAFAKATLLTGGLIKSDCGANAPGGGGFQPDNTCATGGAAPSTQKRAQPVVSKPKPMNDAEFREMQIQWTKKSAVKIESQIQAAKQAVAEKEANMPMYGRADRQTYRELREAEASLRRAERALKQNQKRLDGLMLMKDRIENNPEVFKRVESLRSNIESAKKQYESEVATSPMNRSWGRQRIKEAKLKLEFAESAMDRELANLQRASYEPPSASDPKRERVREVVKSILAKADCGANAKGGGGFRKGNTCGGEKGTAKPTAKEGSKIDDQGIEPVDNWDSEEGDKASGLEITKNLSPKAKTLLRRFNQQMAFSQDVTEENRQFYVKTMEGVLANMNDKSAELAEKGVKEFRLFNNSDELGAAVKSKYAKHFEDRDTEGFQVGGMYDYESGVMYLDGGAETGGNTSRTAGVYAHEMTHAIDKQLGKMRSKYEWIEAYHTDKIADGRLSQYARENSGEGLAEFGRLLWGQKSDMKKVESAFPNAVKVFRERGLL